MVSRAVLSKATGGLIPAKTLSNEDALRKGPAERVWVGFKIGYTRASSVAYIRKKFNYYDMFEAIMNDFTPCSANQTASDKELCYAYEVAER